MDMFFLRKVAAVLVMSAPSYAADHYLSGNIINITTTASGLMIMLDSGILTNCQGTPSNWMLIKEENKTMVSMALAMWGTGKKSIVVYTSPVKPGWYCEVTQLDPNE